MIRRIPGTLLLVAALVVVAVGAAALVGPGAPADDAASADASVEQFGNQSAFEAYVERGQRRTRYSTSGMQASRATADRSGDAGEQSGAVEEEATRARPQATQTAMETETAAFETETDDDPDRVGTTNVQVAGLDEPDLVKTDGSHFYYAQRRTEVYHREPATMEETPTEDGVAPPERRSRTHVIDVNEPADPAAVAEIEARGRLLRTGDQLVVIEDDRLVGYEVSDPENPVQAWTRPLEDRVVTARSRDGSVYLVTQTSVHADPRCPIEPMGEDAAIPCGDVYRPDAQVAVDATYSAFALDAATGDVRDSVSFVGTGRGTVVYMSNDALYVTYTERTDRVELGVKFLTEEFDRTPERVERRIEEIRGYDISAESKQREIRRAVREWLQSVDDEKRHELQRDLSEGLQSYVADHQRELTRTGIVRVDVDGTDLAVESTGSVPGRPLNQFSLSQHDGHLRIATTIPGRGRAESENDLYTLEASSLTRVGSVTGMGDGQRVYAVRYVGDTAYVVTFRQIDPLHVVDLSNPANPIEEGTLELPGFSSYLHPIDGDHVLGIGEEDGEVKTVLFDVSDPTDPEIADSKILDARWSAVRDTHHAFTIDRRHGVFFLPAGGDGLVVDYENGTLSRVHTVETREAALRARYIDDYLYVFAGSTVAVVDETTWERAATLDLDAD